MMKKLFLFSTFPILALSSAQAYVYLNSSAENALWSVNTNWVDNVTTVSPATPPNDNVTEAQLWWSTKSLKVDGDYTVNGLGCNRDTGCSSAINGLLNVNLKGAKSDGGDGSITIDLANKATLSNAISFQTNAKSGAEDLRFVFKGGTVNITDSNPENAVHNATIFINGEDGKNFTGYKKSITFDKDNTLNSTENIILRGWSSAGAGPVVTFNFAGNVNLIDSVEGIATYRNLIIETGNAAATTLSLTANIESTAVFNIGALAQKKNTESVIDGNVSIKGGYEFYANMRAGLYITGGKMTVNGNMNIMAKTEATEAIRVADGGELIVNNSLNLDRSVNVANKATLTLGALGRLVVTENNDAYVMVNDGKLIIDNNTANAISTNRGLRLQSSTVVFNGNGLSSDMVLWMISNYSSKRNCVIEINADINFKAFSWIQGNRTELTFSNGAMLTLDSLSTAADSWGKALVDDVMLILNNYENGSLRVKNTTNAVGADDLTKISGSGFEDGSFAWVWHQETNNYWLEGVAVPEPSAIAAILAALALGFAIVRRRK